MRKQTVLAPNKITRITKATSQQLSLSMVSLPTSFGRESANATSTPGVPLEWKSLMALVACEACGCVSDRVCVSACCRRRLCDGCANGVRATTLGQCPACEYCERSSANEWATGCQAERGAEAEVESECGAGTSGSSVYSYGGGSNSGFSGRFIDGFSGGGCSRLRVQEADSQTRALLQMRTECTRCGACLPLAAMRIHMATLCSRRRHTPYELDSGGTQLGIVDCFNSSNELERVNGKFDVGKNAEKIVDGKLNRKRHSMDVTTPEIDNLDLGEKIEDSHEDDVHEPPITQQKITVQVDVQQTNFGVELSEKPAIGGKDVTGAMNENNATKPLYLLNRRGVPAFRRNNGKWYCGQQMNDKLCGCMRVNRGRCGGEYVASCNCGDCMWLDLLTSRVPISRGTQLINSLGRPSSRSSDGRFHCGHWIPAGDSRTRAVLQQILRRQPVYCSSQTGHSCRPCRHLHKAFVRYQKLLTPILSSMPSACHHESRMSVDIMPP